MYDQYGRLIQQMPYSNQGYIPQPPPTDYIRSLERENEHLKSRLGTSGGIPPAPQPTTFPAPPQPTAPIAGQPKTQTTNAYSISVSSEAQAEAYPVNQELDDMFFLCGKFLYVKTFDLGKGKWNDMRRYELVENNPLMPVESAPPTNEILTKFEELRLFVAKEIEELKHDIKPKPPVALKTSKKPVVATRPRVEEEYIEEDYEDYDEPEEPPKITPAPRKPKKRGGNK